MKDKRDEQHRRGGESGRGGQDEWSPISFQQLNKQGHNEIEEKPSTEKTESEKELEHLYTVNK